jgi:hypothetical protein
VGFSQPRKGVDMDPIDLAISARTAPFPDKKFFETFLPRLLGLSGSGRAGDLLTFSVTPDLLRLTLSLAPSSPAPAEIEWQAFLDELTLAPSSGKKELSLVVRKEPQFLLWTFKGASGWSKTFTSRLVDAGKNSLFLKSTEVVSGASGGLTVSFSLVPEALRQGATPKGPLSRLPVEGGSRSAFVPAEGPVVAYPSWVPGKTVECAIRWCKERPEDRGLKERKSGEDAERIEKISFSLDIPWDDRPKGMSSREGDGEDVPRMVRILGLFDRNGSIALTARHAPDSFRDHLESLQAILEKSLALYPGVSLSLVFSSAVLGTDGGTS